MERIISKSWYSLSIKHDKQSEITTLNEKQAIFYSSLTSISIKKQVLKYITNTKYNLRTSRIIQSKISKAQLFKYYKNRDRATSIRLHCKLPKKIFALTQTIIDYLLCSIIQIHSASYSLKKIRKTQQVVQLLLYRYCWRF